MAGQRTAKLGRFLSAFGWIWMLGALITAFIGQQGVPFLPGVAIYLVGKTMTALGKRGAAEGHDIGTSAPSTTSVEPAPAPRPPVEERPVSQRNEYLGDRRTRDPEPEESFDIPDLEEAILESPPPMSSEEMVAEARRRFGPRPFDEED